MNEATNSSAHAGKQAQNVVYVTPSAKLVESYAHAVYAALKSKSTLKPDPNEDEFIRGFAAFVTVINRIQVKHLNKGVMHDEEQSLSGSAA